eukprot:scaffold241_cov242-Pinguiococcus_pyrenoidosus.AAC.8
MADLLDHGDEDEGGGVKWLLNRTGEGLDSVRKFSIRSVAFGWGVVNATGPYVWWAAMTAVFAFAPLVFEGQREAEVLKEEQVMIKQLREEGFSSTQIAQMGYGSAVAPSVLQDAK